VFLPVEDDAVESVELSSTARSHPAPPGERVPSLGSLVAAANGENHEFRLDVDE
jgi:hypothetical protein